MADEQIEDTPTITDPGAEPEEAVPEVLEAPEPELIEEPGYVAPTAADIAPVLGDQADPNMIQEMVDFAVQNGMTPEMAKAIASREVQLTEESAKASEEQWQSLHRKWAQEIKDDPVLQQGSFEKNVELIKRVVTDYGGKVGENGRNELQEVLNLTGAGNNPALLRFILGVAKALPGEGRPVGGNPAPTTRSFDELTVDQAAAKLFPTMGAS